MGQTSKKSSPVCRKHRPTALGKRAKGKKLKQWKSSKRRHNNLWKKEKNNR